MNNQTQFCRLFLATALASVVLGTASACSSDDPYLKAKANQVNAQASIDYARASDMQANTEINKEKWGLERTQEQAKADAAVATLQSQASLQQAQTEAEINRLRIATDVQRAYAPSEKEAELQRQWLGFFALLTIACIVVGAVLAICVDRYRIVRNHLLAKLENKIGLLNTQLQVINLEIGRREAEIAQYSEMLKQELSKIRKAQQQFQQLCADIQGAEETLRQLDRQVVSVGEKAKKAEEAVPKPATIPLKTSSSMNISSLPLNACREHSKNGNGNGRGEPKDDEELDLPVAS